MSVDQAGDVVLKRTDIIGNVIGPFDFLQVADLDLFTPLFYGSFEELANNDLFYRVPEG